MPLNLDPILYPNLLHQNWQMSHSERLAISQLLHQIKPDVAIEVGTYQGGSLSLISSMANKVYSLDIDAGVADRYASFGNVDFIIGDSGTTLPNLLSELSTQGADVGWCATIALIPNAAGVCWPRIGWIALISLSRIWILFPES